MRFSPHDVVFRVQLNLEQVSTADEAMRVWLPLVAELQPSAVTFKAAHPDGLRRGFLAGLLVAAPLAGAGSTGSEAVDGKSARGRLSASVSPLARRLGLDPGAFEADEEGAGGVLGAKDGPVVSDDAPHGAYLLHARIGADPLNPEGEEADYADTGEDLL
ncbi:hypothetical protein [Streptomyces sp. cmx-18-6]|uniref:hypothetical protein n=1 Tax=Streptomyces sp. cmx-18-6 TaxID=2790930 RepID=UPI00398068FA